MIILGLILELSNVSSVTDANIEKAQSSLGVVYEENLRISKKTREICSSDTLQVGEAELNRERAVAASVGNQVDISMSKSGYSLSSSSSPRDGGISDSSPLLDSSHDGILLLFYNFPFVCGGWFTTYCHHIWTSLFLTDTLRVDGGLAQTFYLKVLLNIAT